MNLVKFRIRNFRSIVDSGWCEFSPDGVTVLVGQNESGKTSVLSALSKTFSDKVITDQDLRFDSDLPRFDLQVKLTPHEVSTMLFEYRPDQVAVVSKYFEDPSAAVTIGFVWQKSKEKKGSFSCKCSVDDQRIAALFGSCDSSTSSIVQESVTASTENDPPSFKDLTLEAFGDELYENAPLISLFSEQTGLLPDTIDIDQEKGLIGAGAQGANNFLRVAGLSIKELIGKELRSRETLLRRANDKITREFGNFWSQAVGRSSKIQLECKLETYGVESGAKAGQAYLVFWITDATTRLYPTQRSQGVRWFLSFFLQLKASEMSDLQRVFLLDEPGANLHSKAQRDVLKLINQLSEDTTIVYSTHSPELVEYDKMFRILAVQRKLDSSDDDSPTEVVHAHKLCAASTDTLSPILTAMGVDLSRQQVIHKHNNVLLEEISGFYYLRSFWLLTNQQKSAHFIACSGVGNVPQMAQFMLGWGLEYIVAVDDDQHGRQTFKKIKETLCGNDDDIARQLVIRFRSCQGIEDIFSKRDFSKYILGDESVSIGDSNSEFLKRSMYSKPVLGFKFLRLVQAGSVTIDSFETETVERIRLACNEISARLTNAS